MKRFFTLFVFAIFTTAIVIGAFWYRKTNTLRQEAATIVNAKSDLDRLSSQIENEYSRCQMLISEGEGRFKDFEYCQKFIEWIANNEIIEQ